MSEVGGRDGDLNDSRPSLEGEEGDERRRAGEGGEDAAEIEERLEWFRSTRVDAKDEFPPGLLAQASAKRRRLEGKGDGELPPAPPGGAGSANWTPIGPSVVGHGQATGNPPVSGRISSIEVGPNATRVYVGAANGGVWFSDSGGAAWKPQDDYAIASPLLSGLEADSLSIGALAVRFGAGAGSDTVFAGTGEPNFSVDAYFGIGVLSSPDGGSNWTLEATNLAGRGVFRIVLDPSTPTGVFAATTAGLWQRPAAAPFTTWTQITSPTFANSNGRVSDLVVTLSGGIQTFYAAFSGDKVYSSIDAVTWTALSGLPANPQRISLAAGESSPTVYALIQDGSLYRLDGTTFQQVTPVPPSASFVGTQGWYDLVVAVDPTNADVVYLAGNSIWDGANYNLSFFRGTIGGGPGAWTFSFDAAHNGNPTADSTWIGLGVHGDAHALAFALNAAGTAHVGTDVWIGTDGGPFRSTMSGSAGTFKPRNTGLAITQMTYLAQRPDTDAVLFAGCQDNGTLRCWGEPAWYESPQGDGGGVAIDPNNQYSVIRQYVRAGRWVDNPALPPGNLARFAPGLYTTTDGGVSGSWSSVNFPPITASTSAQKVAANTENGSTGFYGPIKASPPGVTPTQVAFGTNRLWLSSDWGTSWVTLPTNTNPYAGATPNAGQDVLDGSVVVAIACASGVRLFAATRNQVWRFDLSGGTWTSTAITTTGLPAGRIITSIAVDDATMGTFYVTLGGSGVDHVWYFDGTWHIALPKTTVDIPTHAIVVDAASPNTIYAGTDIGCWQGTKSGLSWTWALFSQGLPEAAITDLAIHSRAPLLRAATHGRGIWEISIDPAVTPRDPDLYLRVNTADTGRMPNGNRYPWVEGTPDPTREGSNAYHWMSPDIKVRRPSYPVAPPALSSPPDYLDFAVNVADYVDSQDTETADTVGANNVFVQVHNRSVITPVNGSDVRVLLLITDAAGGLPALPTDYALHINNGDLPASWLAGSQWKVADPGSPYRSPSGVVDVRTPGVVEFSVDIASVLGALPAGHDHVCAAAFVTTPGDPLVGGTASMDQLTMQDNNAAHRNLHLVAPGATPIPPSGEVGRYNHQPETFVIDFYNAKDEDDLIDIIFDRRLFPGHMSLMLSKPSSGKSPGELNGFFLEEHSGLQEAIRVHLASWLEGLGEWIENVGERIEQAGMEGQHLSDEREIKFRGLSGLDRTRVYVATDGSEPTIGAIEIPAGGRMTAAVTILAPENARPGDSFRFDIIQRSGGRIVGGSSYVVVIRERP